MLKPGSTLRFVLLSFLVEANSASPPVCHRQDPKPTSVEPARGPAAGGTVITIRGKDLDTASQEDVTVSVGGVPCQVYATSSSSYTSCFSCSPMLFFLLLLPLLHALLHFLLRFTSS